jgi:hypothetical protein
MAGRPVFSVSCPGLDPADDRGDEISASEPNAPRSDSIVAQNPREDVTVDINREGVPVACWFVPKNCADDCGMGFGLGDFACGALAPADGGVGQD